MKKAFEILASTLLELVIYTLLLSGFYYLFCFMVQNSLGNSIGFSLPFFFSCVVRYTPTCSIFSVLLLIFKFIKRNCSFSEMILPYAIVSGLVWIVLVPLSLKYDSGFITFSYYGGSFEGTAVGFTWWIERLPAGSDAASLFALPDWTSFLLKRFEKLHYWLVTFFQETDAFFGLMQYASFFLSLAAIGCFARFSSWRLWNAFFVIIAFGASVVLNSYLFDYSFMSTLGLNDFMAKWLPLFVNAGVFLLYTLFGLFSLIDDAKKRRG